MTTLTRLRIAPYFLAGHTFRGCARKYRCTVRQAEEAVRVTSREMRGRKR
jgi:hypothetical protein